MQTQSRSTPTIMEDNCKAQAHCQVSARRKSDAKGRQTKAQPEKHGKREARPNSSQDPNQAHTGPKHSQTNIKPTGENTSNARTNPGSDMARPESTAWPDNNRQTQSMTRPSPDPTQGQIHKHTQSMTRPSPDPKQGQIQTRPKHGQIQITPRIMSYS